MATSSQDGAPGAGTHAQAEAMGLGPATIVRLERALAHEVSPLLHSHAWICAEGGAGYKIKRCRHGDADNTAAGIRKRPSTQASSHGTGVGRARSNSSGRLSERHRTCGKPPMVNQCDRPCQATRRGTRIYFLRIHREARVLVGLVCTVWPLTWCSHLFRLVMHSLWITMWKEGIRCSHISPTRVMGSGQHEWGPSDCD